MTVPSSAPAIAERYWIVALSRAVVALAAGAFITFSADHSAGLGLVVFGAYALAAGIVCGVGSLAIADRVLRGAAIAQGAFGVIAGILALTLHSSGLGVLLYTISVWAALTGFTELYGGVRARGRAPVSRDWLIVGGLTAVLAIVYLVIPPRLGARGRPVRCIHGRGRRLPRDRSVQPEVGLDRESRRGEPRMSRRNKKPAPRVFDGTRTPNLREQLKPVELIGIAAVLAIFAGLVVLLGTREPLLAVIFFGIAFIVALVVLAMFVLGSKPDPAERDDLAEQNGDADGRAGGRTSSAPEDPNPRGNPHD